MRIIILIHLMALTLSISSFAQVRTVIPKTDELLTIKTALGIATIVQTPQAIQSAIIGDQSGFKVEYLDKAVTLKPLRSGARTNLYILTDSIRYNLRLLTIGQDAADYIVYIKEPGMKEQPAWKVCGKTVQSSGMSLKVIRLGFSDQGFILIEAQISSKDAVLLKPEQFWISQGKDSKSINHLFLSDLHLTSKAAINIGIAISKSDLNTKKSLAVEYRGQEKMIIVLPEDLLWK